MHSVELYRIVSCRVHVLLCCVGEQFMESEGIFHLNEITETSKNLIWCSSLFFPVRRKESAVRGIF